MPTTTSDSVSLRETVAAARRENRSFLLEHETRPVLDLLGIQVPAQRFIRLDEEPWEAAREACEEIPGTRVVVKVVASDIQHKTEIGGVRFAHKQPVAIVEAIRAMAILAAGYDVRGFLVSELVEHDLSLGSELLLAIRWTADFGPVVSFGAGGIATELLARNLERGREIAVLSPGLTRPERIPAILAGKAITQFVTGVRNQAGAMPMPELADFLAHCCAAAPRLVPDPFDEIEINPLVPTARGPIALDVLVRIAAPSSDARPRRPLEKMEALLRPRSVAIAGVSKSMNPGRLIVRNLLAEGFDRNAITIIKPGEESLDGCRCVPAISALPERTDLLVLAVAAEQAVTLFEEAVDNEKAESVVIIPGGLGEHEGSEGLEQRVLAAIRRARATEWRGPVVNGPNCLGIHSAPGRVDTIFLPPYKLRAAEAQRRLPEVPAWGLGGPPPQRSAGTVRRSAPLAIVSQSGAFGITTASKLPSLQPRYLISIGNQIDLTAGDYMTFLENDEGVEVFAFYIEGFHPLDGRRWVEAAGRAAAAGRPVILYRAGRTAAGLRATASHTAAIAGDAVITRELASAAGAIVAESLEDFEDLVRLFTLLGRRRSRGCSLAALSNAGFESVAFADHLGGFELAPLNAATRERLGEVLRENRLDRIVTVDNPLDVNPLLGDEAFVAAAAALLSDSAVDAAVIGCVPLTGALQTLPAAAGHREDLLSAGSVVSRLIGLWNQTDKPWVTVIDAGPLYDPMAMRLQENGVPVFRTGDRALRLLGIWCEWSLTYR